MKFGSIAMAFAVFFFLALPVHAVTASFSVNDPANILAPGSSFLSTYATPLDAQLEGLFDFVYVGSEASHTNVLLTTAAGDHIFNNKVTASGTWANGLDIEALKLDDLSVDGFWLFPNQQYAIDEWSWHVHVYELNQDVMINSVGLTAGMFLFGFDDQGGTVFTSDFDDLVFAARSASPVPIPGAALLLGSSLLALFGMKRRVL